MSKNEIPAEFLKDRTGRRRTLGQAVVAWWLQDKVGSLGADPCPTLDDLAAKIDEAMRAEETLSSVGRKD